MVCAGLRRSSVRSSVQCLPDHKLHTVPCVHAVDRDRKVVLCLFVHVWCKRSITSGPNVQQRPISIQPFSCLTFSFKSFSWKWLMVVDFSFLAMYTSLLKSTRGGICGSYNLRLKRPLHVPKKVTQQFTRPCANKGPHLCACSHFQ